MGFDSDGDAHGDLWFGKRVLSHPTVWRWVQQVILEIVATVGYVGIYDWNGQGWGRWAPMWLEKRYENCLVGA